MSSEVFLCLRARTLPMRPGIRDCLGLICMLHVVVLLGKLLGFVIARCMTPP